MDTEKLMFENKPIAVDVTNNTNEIKEIRLFSGDDIEEGIEIKPILKNITHENITEQLKVRETQFSLLRLFSQNSKQFEQPIVVQENIIQKNKISVQIEKEIIPVHFLSDNQFQAGSIEIPIECVVRNKCNNGYGIILTILPETTLGVRFYEEKIDDNYFFRERESFNYKSNTTSPLQINISNTTDEVKNAVLFGANYNYKKPNYGSDKGIEISTNIDGVNYDSILLDSLVVPFKIFLIRLMSCTFKQVVQPIYYKTTDVGGGSSGGVLFSESGFSRFQFQKGIVDIMTNLIVDNRTELNIEILPKTTLSILLFKEKEIKISNRLKDGNRALVLRELPQLHEYEIKMVNSTGGDDYPQLKKSWLERLLTKFKN